MSRRGNVLIVGIPDETVFSNVLDILLEFEEGATREGLEQGLKSLPFTLREDILQEEAQELTEFFRSLGADVRFSPYAGQKTAAPSQADKAKPSSKPAPKSWVSKAPGGAPVKRSMSWWLKTALIPTLFFLAALALVLIIYMREQKASEVIEGKTPAPPKLSILKAEQERFVPIERPILLTNFVPPEMKLAIYQQQYRLKPDARGLRACALSAEYLSRFHAGRLQAAENYTMGAPLWSASELALPLTGAAVPEEVRVVTDIPDSFPQIMNMLDTWLEVLFYHNGAIPAPKQGVSEMTLSYARDLIEKVDPRSIIKGLELLNQTLEKNGAHPEIFALAAQGYAMLSMCMPEDWEHYSDEMAANGLMFLALAKRMAPDMDFNLEEGLLALVMGYTKHAASRIKVQPGNDKSNTAIWSAYLTKDEETLEAIFSENQPETRLLSGLLLVDSYDESGKYKSARKIIRPLLQQFPLNFSVLSAAIEVENLVTARVLSLFYPVLILAQLDRVATATPMTEEELKKVAAAIAGGEESFDAIPLVEFEDMIEKWAPLAEQSAHGLIINESMVKLVFRGLFANAVEERFEIVADRWGVSEMTVTLADGLLGEDGDDPFILEKKAGALTELGDARQGVEIVKKLLKQKKVTVPPQVAMDAFYGLWNPMDQVSFAPYVARHLDARPSGCSRLAWLMTKLMHVDRAADAFERALKNDPYNKHSYTGLATAQADDAVLEKAAQLHKNDYALLYNIATYFKEQEIPERVEKAFQFYKQGNALAPLEEQDTIQYAGALRRLGRFDDAIAFLEHRLRAYEHDDLFKIRLITTLASVYQRKGDPEKALQVLGNAASSGQGGAMIVTAEVLGELGKDKAAVELYEKAMRRYPAAAYAFASAAGFYWIRNDYAKAAKIIAACRPTQNPIYIWYREDFARVFHDKKASSIIAAVRALHAEGADFIELTGLAAGMKWVDRPEVFAPIMNMYKAKNIVYEVSRRVKIYEVESKLKGEKAAFEEMNKGLSPSQRAVFNVAYIRKGMFSMLRDKLPDSTGMKQLSADFNELMRLIGWIALDRKPESMAVHFATYFSGDSTSQYHAVGRYYLGKATYDELFTWMKDPKKRCEISYYIGLAARLSGDYALASDWYSISRSYRLSNVGERFWATDELAYWSTLGIKRRHRILTQDIEESALIQRRKLNFKLFGSKAENRVRTANAN